MGRLQGYYHAARSGERPWRQFGANLIFSSTFPGLHDFLIGITLSCWDYAKMQKNNAVFFASNPYRLWSLQLGAENMSKVGSFSENIVFCGIKLNYCSVHNFRGARILIYLFACRLARFMHENCGALHWNFPTRKNMDCFSRNAQLVGNAMETLGGSDQKPSSWGQELEMSMERDAEWIDYHKHVGIHEIDAGL